MHLQCKESARPEHVGIEKKLRPDNAVSKNEDLNHKFIEYSHLFI